jgi:tetratricopeptide (TPR) repeat protein
MKQALLALLLVTAGCSSTPIEGDPPPGEDLGTFHRAVTTTSPEAQRAFDRGLVLVYAFDHAEAVRAFQAAARHDPGCAMAYWGIALAKGPYINRTTMDADGVKVAWEAIGKARALESGARPVERALIDALSKRYAKEPPKDRSSLDLAYANAMRQVWREHPDDTDVGTLFAESLMDLHPWDLWVAGKPREETSELIAVLEPALERDPCHPGANHLYIHAVENSPAPAKGIPAADALRTVVPDAEHLIHMSSHIDVLVGHYELAEVANKKAIATSERVAARAPRPKKVASLGLHDWYSLAYACMMEGRSKEALEAARDVIAKAPPLDEAKAKIADVMFSEPLHVLVRFGRWGEILAEPEPRPEFLVQHALWHYARGVALGALGRLDEAEADQKEMTASVAAVDTRTWGNNPATVVLGVPSHMLAGELAFRRGRTDEAIAELHSAVAAEDGLKYNGPPDWMQPARHSLAAILLAAHKPEEAEGVLRDDLERHPENGWALNGLARCLRARGAKDEAKAVEERFERAWARADVKISSPCVCLPGQ